MDMTTIYHTCIMETLGFHENLVTFLVVHTLSCSMANNNLWYWNDFHIPFYDHGNMENTVLFDEKWQNQHPVLFQRKWSQLAHDSVVFVRTMNAEDGRILHVCHGRLTFNKKIWLNHQPIYKSLMFHLRLCQRGFVWPSTYYWPTTKQCSKQPKRRIQPAKLRMLSIVGMSLSP